MGKKTSVVVLNYNADIIGHYPSITAAARDMGCTYANLNHKICTRQTYKKMLFIREREHRELWYAGRTDELKFKKAKERFHERALKGWENLSPEQRSSRMSGCRKAVKELWESGKHPILVHVKKICIPVVCVETGVEYPSISTAAKALGVKAQTLHRRIQEGKQVNGKTYKKIGHE